MVQICANDFFMMIFSDMSITVPISAGQSRFRPNGPAVLGSKRGPEIFPGDKGGGAKLFAHKNFCKGGGQKI